ncbi:Membrane protein involved in the export of O-antigen and teichoic acid [Spirosomataceae bacterium TFI 002]|nr:Membrane protein involved in the export of O-antigen and teichoic acid [Spirosomataceae bacterium TFI 002]
MSLFKKLAGDTVLYGLSSIVGRLLNWLLVIVHTRIFEQPKLLSDNALLYTYVIPLNVIYTFGMETAFFRFASKKEHRNDYFNIILTFILLLGGTLSTLIILGASPIIEELGYPGKERLIYWLAIIILTDAVTAIAFVKLRAQNRAKKFVSIKLISIFINIGLNAFYLMFCNYILQGFILPDWKPFAEYFYNPAIGPDYIIWANYVASVITLLLLWKEYANFKFTFNWEKLKPVINYAYPLLILGLAGTINLTADRLMFRSLLPDGFYPGLTTDDAFSIYAQCYKLSIFMTLVVQAYRYAADPFFFSKMGDKNSPYMIGLSTKWFTIACIVLWVFVSINLDWIKLLLGESYRSGVVIVPILLLANLFIGVYGNISIWYKLTDRTKIGTYITLGGMSLTIVLNIILIPIYGYIGCAITFAISSFLMTAACYYLGQKHYPVPYELKRIVNYLLLGAVAIGITYFLKFESMAVSILFHTIIIVVVVGIIYMKEKNGFRSKAN